MAKTVNEKLVDKYIRHAISIERLKNSEAKAISQFLGKQVFPELIDKLLKELDKIDPAKMTAKWVTTRLRRMTAAIDKLIIAGMGRAEDALVGNLVDLGNFEAEWIKTTIEDTIPVDIDLSSPSKAVIRTSVLSATFDDHKLKTWLKAYKKSVRVEMIKETTKGVVQGESIPQIGRRIRKLASVKRKQAEHIARTAVSSIVNRARDSVYIENKDIITKVQYRATLDTRTTLICINLDGKVFPTDEGPRPPQHFNCRSIAVPVIASWKKFGLKDPPAATRASMNGAVPAKTTYPQWLKKQSAKVQDEVLGKTRGKLYRAGKVKIDKFVSKDYKPLTLIQLKKSGIDID
jgi:SPP1 gp7 family putative phage head morphogenesis protein